MAEIAIRPAFWHNDALMNRVAHAKEMGHATSVKRTAVSIRSKQPNIDWTKGLDEDGGKLGTEFTPEANIYLVDELPEGVLDLKDLLDPYFEIIFEEELNVWHRREKDWPQKRDFAVPGPVRDRDTQCGARLERRMVED